MRCVTKRGDVRYLECAACGRRARKPPSREAEWTKPSAAFTASLDDSRHVSIIPALTPFTVSRGRRS